MTTRPGQQTPPRRTRLRAVPTGPPPVAQVEALPVPAAGDVLFVLTLPPHTSTTGDADADARLIADVRSIAQATAPGRHQVAVLTDGLTLDVLANTDLATLGLQRIPPDVAP